VRNQDGQELAYVYYEDEPGGMVLFPISRLVVCRGLPLTRSNPRKGELIFIRNRKRFDSAVAVVRSVAVAICVGLFFMAVALLFVQYDGRTA
jgi:hypothetical protein